MWVIIGLLILMFALWGIQSYMAPESDPAVASVNGDELSLRQYQERLQRQRYRIQNMLGSQFDPNQIDEKQLQKQVLESMVEEEVLLQSGLEQGMYISDGQLADSIRNTDSFQEDGSFSQARYETALRRLGYSPGSFEYDYRRILLLAQFNAGVTQSSLLPPMVVDNIARLAQQSRQFATLRIPAGHQSENSEVSDVQVTEYFEAHKQEFLSPEQMSVDYVVLDEKRIADQVEVSEDDLRSRYENQKSYYLTDEERRASHILIRVDDPTDAAQMQAAEQKAEAIRQRIVDGGSFADIAASESEDPGSASQGGDLGFFRRGVMDPAFETAVFGMQAGDISGVVKSAFGLHVIRLDEIKPATQKSFEDVRDSLLSEARQDAAAKRFAAQAEQFANVVFENPDTLNVAAEDFGLEIQTSGFFTRDAGQGIAGDERVRNAAFSDEVRQGYNSEPLELGDGRIVALRMNEYRESRQKSQDEVADQIRQRLQQESAAERSRSLGEQAARQLGEGMARDAVAAGLGLEWSDTHSVTRSDKGEEPAVLQKLFRMPRPDAAPVFDGVRLGNGDYVVLALEKVDDEGADKLPDAARQTLEKNLRQALGQEAFDAIVRSLRMAADVVEHQDRL